MSLRSGTRLRATRKPVIVLAGEDGNDRRCLRILIERLCPKARGRIVEINDSVRLRDASHQTLTRRVSVLARKARARAARENASLACIFVHEDLDDTDGPASQVVYERVRKALVEEFGTAHYVLSVAEMEAWLLLFPDALESLVSSWRVPRQSRDGDTGMLSDPKRTLVDSVSDRRRRYRESDSPEVFAKAIHLGCLDRPRGTNSSWSRFRGDADDCCRSHLPRPRSSN